jgi:hypothetical protein
MEHQAEDPATEAVMMMAMPMALMIVAAKKIRGRSRAMARALLLNRIVALPDLLHHHRCWKRASVAGRTNAGEAKEEEDEKER